MNPQFTTASSIGNRLFYWAMRIFPWAVLLILLTGAFLIGAAIGERRERADWMAVPVNPFGGRSSR